MSDEVLQIAIIAIGSLAVGAAAAWAIIRMRWGSIQAVATDIVQKAEQEAQVQRQQAELFTKQLRLDAEREMERQSQEERNKLRREEQRLQTREDKIEERQHAIEKRSHDIDKAQHSLQADKAQLAQQAKELAAQQQLLVTEWERVSNLTSTEAKEQLLSRLQREVEAQEAQLLRKRQKEAEETAERAAATIIATAINRLCVPCVSEATVATVALPSDEMKGRIIGREGRNIRMLERELGVNILIDDTPGAVVLSGFDPIRKQIAKMVLGELVQDGRIHPTRIQEVIAQKRIEIEGLILQHGEDAAVRAGVFNLQAPLIALLGQLKFRYSFGQNVLDHSLEVAALMGSMAAELGLDVSLAKRIGLLHDVGKALSHETDRPHALVGHDLALRYGETEEVANGIGCHHHEMVATTIEGSLCSAADTLSASRPGARVGTLDEYVKRLKDLEEIVHSFHGVEHAYALQAGREVQISVLPDVIDDSGIASLARDISKRIEEKIRSPGRVKVTVVREKRCVEYAG